MAERGIRCGQCGAANDVLAIECRRCSAPLVDYGSEQWEAEQEASVERARLAAASVRRKRFVLLAVVAVVLLGAGGVWARWAVQNTYILTHEPTYADEKADYWVKLLKSPDHYMRRRAAQALAAIADRFSKPNAREVIPPLREALADEDPDVRKFAQSALDRIAASTGEK